MVSWEGLIGAEVFTLCLGARLSPTATRVGDPGRVVILGQSIAPILSNRKSAYPALRQEKIKAEGFNETVVNAGNEGDTAARGLRRSFRGWLRGHGIESAILRMAASHGLIARATFPRVAARGAD